MLKRLYFPLFLIILLFLLKGTFLSAIFPFFQNPDEQVHYATIQYHAEPKEKTWSITKEKKVFNTSNDISTYHFSEETIKSAQKMQFDEIKFQKENIQTFSDTKMGFNEEEVLKNSWERYIDIYPTNTSGTISVYYILGSEIEKILSHTSVFVRFFSNRLLSVFLGVMVVLFAYLTAKKLGFSFRHSFFLAILVAFQPMFSASAAQVNIDIALIVSFSFFVYVATTLLCDGFKKIHLVLLFSSMILAFFSKGPGSILTPIAIALFLYLIFLRFKNHTPRFFLHAFIFVSLLTAIFFLFALQEYLASIFHLENQSQFSSLLESLVAYTNKTLSLDALLRTEASYWGNFGWLDTKISDTLISLIFIIEIIAFIGIILYLISGYLKKMPLHFLRKIAFLQKKEYLPEKKYLLFFLGMIITLQLAIRFYDWRIFDTTEKILIGTPGRYFLPNIIPHIILLVTGLGVFTQNKRQFDILLRVLALLMILLSFYALINVIIPRYYL